MTAQMAQDFYDEPAAEQIRTTLDYIKDCYGGPQTISGQAAG